MTKNEADRRAQLALLTPAEMARADQMTVAAGTPGIELMENAGRAVADAARDMLPDGGRVTVLAGPGNNGGDGFVAARYLAEAGMRVDLALLGARERLSGDARLAAERWTGSAEPLGEDFASPDASLIVDALFGAGLARPLSGTLAEVVDRVNQSGVPVLAVDLPSGVDGLTGGVGTTAFRARRTVTFFRRKPGHLMLPGRQHCGETTMADIGIPDAVLGPIGVRLWENRPALWGDERRRPDPAGHKYDRGHVLVVSGPAIRTGAARLAATAALRAGAGLVTVAAPPAAVPVHAAHLTAVMLRQMEDARALADILSDKRVNAVVVGPAAGVGSETCDKVAAALGSDATVVVDADGITSFSGEPDALWSQIAGRAAATVLTPHDGEFRRAFPDLAADVDKVARAREAARRSSAIVVLKGGDTVVAAPDGRAAIAGNAPPWLASAGTGDVLAGTIAGMAASGMPAFEGACAAVWLHGEAGRVVGEGLIAEDLPGAYRQVFAGPDWRTAHP